MIAGSVTSPRGVVGMLLLLMRFRWCCWWSARGGCRTAADFYVVLLLMPKVAYDWTAISCVV